MLKSIVVILMAALTFQELPASEPENFVTSRINGQLGNQWFQIAAATSLALDYDAIPCFPDLLEMEAFGARSNYENLYQFQNINPNLPPNQQINSHYYEPAFHYTPISYKPNMQLEGYFQSEKYFINNKQAILDLFAPPKHVTKFLAKKYKSILEHPNTVAVHLRNYRAAGEHPLHITYGKEYYERAMALFPDDALFVVCSDFIDLAKKELGDIPRKMIFIEGNPYYMDLYLMSMCKHNIISNSTFSWWAAYLNSNPDKVVITPPYWFDRDHCGHNTKDLLPEGWIVLKY